MAMTVADYIFVAVTIALLLGGLAAALDVIPKLKGLPTSVRLLALLPGLVLVAYIACNAYR